MHALPKSLQRQRPASSTAKLVAGLIARLCRTASEVVRAKAIASLLQPLSPLALLTVADGAFACALHEGGVHAGQIGHVASAQVSALAEFAWQVEPAVFIQVAELLTPSATASTAFAAAALALLMRQLQAVAATEHANLVS
ncbi:hypothetical protein [Ottowia sp.]|uniref:hypothetical protein n=1 Tax=Ottowia sp. TaxID=1898956 RepID=UPI003A8942D7